MMPIVITGNPGVGKHTVAEKVAEKMKLSIMDISKIAGDSGLFEGNYDAGSDTNDVNVQKLGKILEQEISERNLIVGHLAPYVLKKEQVKVMIVLRRNPYELIPVYKDRRYSERKIMENTGSEILGVIANDALERFGDKVLQIDVSKKTVSKVVKDTVKAIINGGKSERVDWLELVKENNDLGKFFAD